MFYYDEHNRMLSYYKYLPNITSTVCYTYLPLTITRLSIPLSTKNNGSASQHHRHSLLITEVIYTF